MHDDERWQAYTESGEPISKPLNKTQAAQGSLHGASHVWVVRQSKYGLEILVQQRAFDKQTWPGLYDISAAGHIDFGETPESAAIRETREEINVMVQPDELRLLYKHRAYLTTPNGIIENELQWIYGFMTHRNIVFDKTSSDGEVAALKWVSKQELHRMIAAGDLVVPHGSIYFKNLFKSLASMDIA